MGVWILMGVPEASAQLSPTHAALEMTGYFSGIHDVHSRGEFDYLDVGVDLSMPDAPPSFRGVSGGGLWRVSIKRTKTGEFSWDHSDISLEGVAFYESGAAEGRRIVRCHGRRTIYRAMPPQTPVG